MAERVYQAIVPLIDVRQQATDIVTAVLGRAARGASDPDASLYYLAAMLEGGEDARYIARRMVILASEDIGNAAPQALQVAIAAAHAVEHVGLPEAHFALAQAAIYLALAPKSNAAGTALSAARAHIRQHGAALPPAALRDAHYPGAKSLGRGKGYDYPHDHPGDVNDQEHLPEGLEAVRFYDPGDTEPTMRDRLTAARRRGAAMREGGGRAGARDASVDSRVQRENSTLAAETALGLPAVGACLSRSRSTRPPAARCWAGRPGRSRRRGRGGRTAQPLWSLVPIASRARYIRRTAVAMLDEVDDLALRLADETGWPKSHIVLSELLPAVKGLHQLAADGPRALADRRLAPRGALLAGPQHAADPVAGGRDRAARSVRLAVGRAGAGGRRRAARRQRRDPRRGRAARGPAAAPDLPARRPSRRAADHELAAGPGPRRPSAAACTTSSRPRGSGRCSCSRARRRTSWSRPPCGPRSPAPGAIPPPPGGSSWSRARCRASSRR